VRGVYSGRAEAHDLYAVDRRPPERRHYG
jgi:hypothetical protein